MSGPRIVPKRTRVVLDDGRRGVVVRVVNARYRLVGAVRIRENAKVVVVCDDSSRAERPVSEVTVEA